MSLLDSISCQWVRHTLTQEGLVVNKKKPKHLCGDKELAHFTKTFWTVDDDHFIHPRNKAQISFIIAVFCWTGARNGACFPDKKDDSKKGLRYRVRSNEVSYWKLRLQSKGY